VVGRAAAVLTSRRALALASLVTAVGLFGAVADDLPDLSEGGAAAVTSVIALPAFLAFVWLALPLARVHPTWLLVPSAAAGVGWALLHWAGLGVISNLSKLACLILFGFWFLSLFEVLWWLLPVALLVPWVDVWSVSAGPTKYVTEERPGLFDSISLAISVPGETTTANIGPPDIVFFALFLAAAQRFGLRVAATWICMTAFLSLTLVLVWAFDSSGLPALPAVCFGFVLPNADLLVKDARDAYAAYAARRREAA
jgi:hypothetical protein